MIHPFFSDSVGHADWVHKNCATIAKKSTANTIWIIGKLSDASKRYRLAKYIENTLRLATINATPLHKCSNALYNKTIQINHITQTNANIPNCDAFNTGKISTHI